MERAIGSKVSILALGGTAVALTSVITGVWTEWQLDGLHAELKEDMDNMGEKIDERMSGLQDQMVGLHKQISALSVSNEQRRAK